MSEITLLKHRIPLTIPNLLSLYRLFTFPVVLFLMISGHEKAYAIMVVINLNTDVWDGFIARRFKQITAIGSRIDSLADIGVYITALSGIIIFKIDEFGPDAWIYYAFIGAYAFTHLFPFLKFGKHQSLHLWSIKLGGWMQGIFFILLFFVGYIPWYFYLLVGISMLAFLESLAIQLILPELYSDARGLIWVLKNRRRQSE